MPARTRSRSASRTRGRSASRAPKKAKKATTKKKTMKKKTTSKIPAVGSKAQVWHGTAKHTSGGLYKKDLLKNKRGRIVSKRKVAAGRKLYSKHKNTLKKHQFKKK